MGMSLPACLLVLALARVAKGRRRADKQRETRPERSGPRRRVVLGVLLLLGAALTIGFAPVIGAKIAQQMASREMNVGALSAAKRWLAWSAWLRPGDYHSDLIMADCHRQLLETDGWIRSLEEAKRKGAPAERIQVESRLGRILSGEVGKDSEMEMEGLARQGAALQGVLAAFVRGYLAAQSRRMARVVLEAWTAQAPDDVNADYMWAVYDRALGDVADAESRLKQLLAKEPRHEPARAELAQVFEERRRPDLAFQQYVELAARSGGSEASLIGMARTLRSLGRTEEARAVLLPLASRSDASLEAWTEMGQIELDLDAYDEAGRWFGKANLERTSEETTASAAAVALTLQGRSQDAEPLVERAAMLARRSVRIYDVLVRLATDPADTAAAEEWKRLTGPLPPGATGKGVAAQESARNDVPSAVSELYSVQCSACHGATGDGRGRAARHLFPRPRDLRSGKSRLVSTVNGVPTLADLESVLALGMPGTSMPSFEKLTETDRTLLARDVVRLRREGVGEEIRTSLRQEGEEVDETELRQAAERCTTPGEPVRLPPDWLVPDRAAARGKAEFVTLGCVKCHGSDGTGTSEQRLYDDQGEPNRARDLVHEPFKGGRDPRSIGLRIVAGMPGSAHPAAANLPQEAILDLVEYVRSLEQRPLRMLTNYERSTREGGWMRGTP